MVGRDAVERDWEELEHRLEETRFREAAMAVGLTPADLECTLDNFDPELGGNERALAVAREFAEKFEPGLGIGLMFYGPRGVGKSHLCAAVCQRVLRRGGLARVRKACVPDLFAASRSAFADGEGLRELLDRLARAHLLWLDDLTLDNIASVYESRRAAELLYRITDRAIQYRQAVLITTNHTPRELQVELQELDNSDRIFDRLRQLVYPVRVNGESVRAEIRRRRTPDWLERVLKPAKTQAEGEKSG